MHIRFWGVRGTIPTPGPDTVKYGGNTACIEARTSDGQLLILDAGSGIRRLGMALERERSDGIEGTILISHTHWDHIQGFPFFAPFKSQSRHKSRFMVVGQKRVGQELESILAGQIIEPYLPFGFQEFSADISFHEMEVGERLHIGPETIVAAAELRHPGGCLGFRIEDATGSLVYCTDTSHSDGILTQSVIDLAQGADLLVHDAQYTVAQRKRFPDYGHSSWLEAARVAEAARVKWLALFHYDPDAADDQLEGILEKARGIFPQTILSSEELTIELPLLEGRRPWGGTIKD